MRRDVEQRLHTKLSQHFSFVRYARVVEASSDFEASGTYRPAAATTLVAGSNPTAGATAYVIYSQASYF